MGTVQGPAGPIDKAEVLFFPAPPADSGDPYLSTSTDDLGRFSLKRVPQGRWVLRARHPGFSPVSRDVVVLRGHGTSAHLTLRPIVQALAGVMVIEDETPAPTLRAQIFEERRAKGEKTGVGDFWDQDDIRKTTHTRVWDLVRTLPGVRVDNPRPGVTLLGIAKCPNPMPWMRSRRDTTRLFIDGVRISGDIPQVLETIHLSNVAGIEMYRGITQLPPEVTDGCSALFIWTK